MRQSSTAATAGSYPDPQALLGPMNALQLGPASSSQYDSGPSRGFAQPYGPRASQQHDSYQHTQILQLLEPFNPTADQGPGNKISILGVTIQVTI